MLSVLATVGGLWVTMRISKWLNLNQSSVAKRKEDMDQHQAPKSFEDIGGCDDAKEAIREIIDYIRNPGPY